MHRLAHEFTSRKVSPWGGIKLFHEAYQQSGMATFFDNGHLPFAESNRGYDPRDLVEQFMTATVLGSKRLAHQEYLRADEVVREIFGWRKGVAAPSTFSRFFCKFDEARNARVLPAMFQEFWRHIPLKRMTIDIDSSVIQRHGKGTHIEGAAKGYNPSKPGHLSHHPIMAFCDDTNMVVNAWMRAGNAADASGAADFLTETIRIAGGCTRVGLIRADAGFYGDTFLRVCEGDYGKDEGDLPYLNPYLTYPDRAVKEAGNEVNESTGARAESNSKKVKSVDYIVRARITSSLAEYAALLDDAKWHTSEITVAKGGKMRSEYAEVEYQAEGWKKKRRIIFIRRLKKLGVAGTQPKLFAEDERLRRYTLAALVTSLDGSAKQIHRLYNGRADCENRIKELKADYGINGYALKKQSSTEAAFCFTMLAYNIMGLLKQYVLKNQNRLSTLRFQCIAIGSYLVKSGRKKKMKLSAEGKRKHFLEHVFKEAENIEIYLR